MTYVTNKPDPGPSPKLDAPAIQGNFSAFSTIFAKVIAGVKYNHTALNDFNQGDHESVIFKKQSADPGVTTNLAVLYAKDATSTTGGTQPELFVQVPKFLPATPDTTDALNVGMQLTYPTVNTAGPLYQSFLAGGYVLYFGSTSNIANTITVTPTPTQLIVAIAETNNMTTVGTPIPYTFSTNITGSDKFKIFSSLNGTGPVVPYTFTWMAIGIQ